MTANNLPTYAQTVAAQAAAEKRFASIQRPTLRRIGPGAQATTTGDYTITRDYLGGYIVRCVSGGRASVETFAGAIEAIKVHRTTGGQTWNRNLLYKYA